MADDFSNLSDDQLEKEIRKERAALAMSKFDDAFGREKIMGTGDFNPAKSTGAFARSAYHPFQELYYGGSDLLFGKSPEREEAKYLSREKFRQAQEEYPLQAGAGSLFGLGGSSKPFYMMAEKVAKSTPYIKGLYQSQKALPSAGARFTTGALGSGAYGGLLSPPEGETRGDAALVDALIGGTIDAAAPAVGGMIRGLGTGAKKVSNVGSKIFSSQSALEDKALEEIISKMTPLEKETFMRQYAQGQRAGFQQRPSEVTGSPRIKSLEELHASKPRGQEQARLYDEAESVRRGDQTQSGQAVESFLNRVSPQSGDYSTRVQDVVDSIIKRDMDARRDAATPLYQATYNTEVSPNKLNALIRKDGTLEKVFDQVSSDPDYRRQIGKYKENQVGFLNQVVIDLGQKAQSAISGEKPDRAMYAKYKTAQEDLVNLMGEDYKKARAVFAEDSLPIDLLKESPLGKIAKYKDYRVENTPKDLFNPNLFSEKDMRYVKKQIEDVDPEAWRGIVRESMEDSLSKGKTAKNLYNNIFKDDKKFKMYYEALRGDQKALLRMRDLKGVLGKLDDKLLKNISNDESKSMFGTAASFIKALSYGRYDKAMIDVITDPNLSRRVDDALRSAKKNNYEPLQNLLRTLADEGPKEISRTLSAMQAQERAE